MTLAEFLRARMDEYERKAKRVRPRKDQKPLRVMSTRHGFEPPFLVVDSAWVLADVDADRRIVDECERTLEYEDHGWALAGDILELLALPYAGHPDYREEWRP